MEAIYIGILRCVAYLLQRRQCTRLMAIAVVSKSNGHQSFTIFSPPAPSSIDVLVVPRLVALHEIEQEGEANMVRERGAAMAALADSDASDGNGEVANS